MRGSDEFRAAMSDDHPAGARRVPARLVIISAGFDAHRDDPLAQLMLVEADYAWVTERLVELAAAKHAAGRIVSSLEGGYDLDAPRARVGRAPMSRR